MLCPPRNNSSALVRREAWSARSAAAIAIGLEKESLALVAFGAVQVLSTAR